MALEHEDVEYPKIASALVECMYHVEPLVKAAALSDQEARHIRSLLTSLNEIGSTHADAVLALALCNYAIEEWSKAAGESRRPGWRKKPEWERLDWRSLRQFV